MSSRQSARGVGRGLVGVGVVGLSAALAAAPLSAANADTPATPSPSPQNEPTASVSPSATPSSTAATPTPSPTAQIAKPKTTPSPTAPRTTSTPEPQMRVAAAAVIPLYGTQKIRVGVQIASGAYVAPGVDTAGSVFQIQYVTPGGANDGAPVTCTTQIATLTGTTTYCGTPGNPVPAQLSGGPGDSAVITQISAPSGLVVDPTPQTVPGCVSLNGVAPFCPPVDVIFNDSGLPPVATNDSATINVTASTKSVDVPILANDNVQGAPVTGLAITSAPHHGTATVVAVGPVQQIEYTPNPGYIGHDSLTYSVSTANGTSSATVALTVVAPPVAVDDTAKILISATTKSVNVPVLANDKLNGGALTGFVVTVPPKHGTATVVTVAGVHEIRYTPDHGYKGSDEFAYRISTANGSSTATASVTVRSATVILPSPPVGPSVNTGASASTGSRGGVPGATELGLVAGAGLLIGGGALARRRRVHDAS